VKDLATTIIEFGEASGMASADILTLVRNTMESAEVRGFYELRSHADRLAGLEADREDERRRMRADRNARYRAKKEAAGREGDGDVASHKTSSERLNGVSQSVSETSHDSRSFLDYRPCHDLEIQEKEERKKESANRAPRPRLGGGHALPSDWLPSAAHFALAERLGITHEAVNNAATEMRDWATANANRAIARKSDWNAAFSNWLRRLKTSRLPNPSRPLTPHQQQKAKADAALEELRAHNRARQAEFDRGPGYSRAEDSRLLSADAGGGPASIYGGADRAFEPL
jgi:hypothetical protein